MKTMFALAFLLCISVAFGLKCYTCHTNTSMADCDKNRKETDCGSSFDRCGKQIFEYKSIKRYLKYCAAKAGCDNISSALKQCPEGATCKAECCDGDLCNGGASPTGAFRLKCYTCYANTSMADCDKNGKETDCGSRFDRCGKQIFEYKSIKRYVKHCAAKAGCDNISSALKQCPEGATCKAECCDGDLCNGGASPTGAFGLKCYTCFSNTSMDDCDKHRRETGCGSSYDRCGKQIFEYKSIKHYRKVCVTKTQCNNKSSALKQCPEGATCKADCCDENLCNGGSAPVNSAILMVACALVAFFR